MTKDLPHIIKQAEENKEKPFFKDVLPKLEIGIDLLSKYSLANIYEMRAKEIAESYCPSLKLTRTEMNAYTFENLAQKPNEKGINILHVIFYSDSIGVHFK